MAIIAVLFPALLGKILGLIASIMLVMNVLSIMLELILRVAFFPIALGSVVAGGISSPGVRYIKKFVAIIFSAAACGIVVIAAYAVCDTAVKVVAEAVNNKITIAGAASGSDGTITAGQWFEYIALMVGIPCVAPFVAVGGINTIKSVASEAFGA